MSPVIKKHANRNHYLLARTGQWIRDFTQDAPAVDINRLFPSDDLRLAIVNENANRTIQLPGIDAEQIFAPRLVIVSDGFDYSACIPLLKTLAKKSGLIFIGVHSVLSRWEQGLRYNYYLVNHPGMECMTYFPMKHQYLPTCIASARTNPQFVKRYLSRGGLVYRYIPTQEAGFTSGLYRPLYCVDDYRNAICACLSLAARWHAQQILLVAPHELFAESRPATEKLLSGRYIYPQQLAAHAFVSGMLYWLVHSRDCRIAAVSSGPELGVEQLSPETAAKFFEA